MDVFPTSLSRHSLFRVELAVATASITAGYAFQKPEKAVSSVASPDTQAVLKLATGLAIQNLVPLETSSWGNELGYAELLLRPQPDGNPTGWLLKDAVNESDRIWRLNLKEGTTSQNSNSLDADQLVALMTWHLTNNKTVTEQLPGATVVVNQGKSLLPVTQASAPGLRNIPADEACFTVFDLPSYEGTGDNSRRLIDAKIYTGPYVPVSLSDEKPVMAASPIYRNGTPGLGGVEALFVSDAGAQIKAVQNEGVDTAPYSPTQQAKNLEGDTQAKFGLGEPGNPNFYLTMNVVKSVFAEAKVWRALLRLIDYKTLAADVIRGFYEPVSSFYDPKFPYAIDTWKTDTAEVEQLLGETGTTKSDSGWLLNSGELIVPELLAYPQWPDSNTLVLAPQTQFKEHGIRVTIRQVSDTTVEMEGSNWDTDVVSNRAVSSGDNPIPPLQRYYYTGGNRNYSHISDPELDALIDEPAVILDEMAAKDLPIKVQQRIGDQGYNGFCGRRRPVVAVGQRMPKCTSQHALV